MSRSNLHVVWSVVLSDAIFDSFPKFNDIVVTSALASLHSGHSILLDYKLDFDPGQIMTHNATSSRMLTISVNLTLSLLAFSIWQSLILVALKTCQSYLWGVLGNVVFDSHAWDSAIRVSSTVTDSHAILSFSTIAVDASHRSLTMISTVCTSLTTISVVCII